MRRRFLLLVVPALLAAACGGDDDDGEATDTTGRPQPITIASFGFSESRTLAEIYAQALEREGLTVTRPLGAAAREVVEPAIEQGAVDVVPEYLGTALAFLEQGRPPPITEEQAYTRLRRAFANRGVTVAEPADAENKNGLVVTRATARRLGLRLASDLALSAPTLVLGGPPECPERPLCLPGFREVYGLRFQEFRPLDAGGPLTVGALEGGEIDVAVLFTSDGHLAGDEFVLLQDDRNLQPPENVVPVVRTVVAQRFPGLVRVLNAVSEDLDTPELVALNRRVDIDGVTPERAAREWLEARQDP